MLMKNPDERITMQQLLQNEFILSSLAISEKTNTSNKIKSISGIFESNLQVDHSNHSSKNTIQHKKKSSNSNNQINSEQNNLQLPSYSNGLLSNLSNGSMNGFANPDQNFLKSINSIFIGSSKNNFESSSMISDIFSPSHVSNSEFHKKSVQTNTISSNLFTGSNTLTGKMYSYLNNNNNTLKTGKSDDYESDYPRQKIGIFRDENPVKELMRKIKKTWKVPHPSKN